MKATETEKELLERGIATAEDLGNGLFRITAPGLEPGT